MKTEWIETQEPNERLYIDATGPQPKQNTFYASISPPRNFSLRMGDTREHSITYTFWVKKTLRNRIKWWLFCRFFPFVIDEWE